MYRQPSGSMCLTWKCRWLCGHGRRLDLARADRRDGSKDVIPVSLDPLDVEGFTNERRQVFGRLCLRVQNGARFSGAEDP